MLNALCKETEKFKVLMKITIFFIISLLQLDIEKILFFFGIDEEYTVSVRIESLRNTESGEWLSKNFKVPRQAGFKDMQTS